MKDNKEMQKREMQTYSFWSAQVFKVRKLSGQYLNLFIIEQIYKIAPCPYPEVVLCFY